MCIRDRPQSDRRKLTPGDELAGEASGDVQQVGRFVHGQHEAIGWCWCRQRAPFVEVVVVADGVHGVSPFSVESTVSILRVNVTLGADNVTLAAGNVTPTPAGGIDVTALCLLYTSD